MKQWLVDINDKTSSIFEFIISKIKLRGPVRQTLPLFREEVTELSGTIDRASSMGILVTRLNTAKLII